MQKDFKDLLNHSLKFYDNTTLRNEIPHGSERIHFRAACILRELKSDKAAEKAKEIVECMANDRSLKPHGFNPKKGHTRFQ